MNYQSTTIDYTFSPYATSQPPDNLISSPFQSPTSQAQKPPAKLVSPPFGPSTSRTQAVLLLSESHLSLYVRPVKSINDTPRIITRVEFLIWFDGVEVASAIFEHDEIIGFRSGGTGFGIPDIFAVPSREYGLEGIEISIRICQEIPLDHDLV